MKRALGSLLLACLLSGACRGRPAEQDGALTDLERRADAALSQISGNLEVAGLAKPVEIIRDDWGIPHIFAETTADLFFAQGFAAAQDRMWQLEIWRRTAEGRLAEILGPSVLDRDRFARFLEYRGDWDAEFRSYHPQGREIVEAFASGVNAAIDQARGRLPIEFQVTGIEPGRWTARTVVSRMAGFVMTRNASSEVWRAQLVKALGVARTEELAPLNPPAPIRLPRGLDLDDLDGPILRLLPGRDDRLTFNPTASNNWVVDGTRSVTGKPLVANDPHRPILNPSLRTIVHLNAPGWDVLGAGEPALPGISTGHNGRIAWGITILGIDQQDLYVEETDPSNPDRYRDPTAPGGWSAMRVERERIPVKGQAPADVTLKFTRHGPVIHEDAGRHRAYALRWVGTEPGTAGYLGALSIHQADSWEAFRRGIEQWKVPSLNLVYADVDGNIGYHGVGLTPVRREGNGLLPVPGRTRDHDWVSYLPISELPRRFNPPEHFVATANHNVIPPGYPHLLGNELAPSFRYERIVEVLGEARRFSIADFEKLQHDAVSLPARRLVSLLAGVESDDPGVREALRLLAGWDGRVGRDLAAAAIYEVWFPVLSAAVYRQHVPDTAWSLLQGRFSTDRVLEWLRADAGRGRILLATLRQALDKLATRLGPDMKTWRWGTLHVAEFDHALGTTGPLRALFHLPSVPRDGDGETVGNTGSGSADQLQQRTGASYRHILDLADWDRSVGTNVPGQSGQPRSPHYGDLVPYWAEQRYFPLLFSRAAIEKHARHRLRLVPRG